MRRIICSAILLWSAALSLAGEKANKLEGLVIDGATGQKLEKARITIDGTTVESRTDINGYFVMDSLGAGSYTLRAEKKGSSPAVVKEVLYYPEKGAILFLKLWPASQKKQAEENESDGTGQLAIAAGRTKNMPEPGLGYIIRQTPGTVIHAGQMHLRGGDHDELAYFVDGFDVSDRHFGVFSEHLPSRAIAGIEITGAGFPVSIGQSMSGAVDIITERSESSADKGIKWTSDMIQGSTNSGYNKFEGFWNSAIPKVNDLRFSFNAEVADRKGIIAFNMPEKIYVPDHSQDYIWADTLYYSHSVWDTVPGSGGSYGWVGDWADTIRHYDSLYAAGGSDVSGQQMWELEKQDRLAHGRMYGWKEWDQPYLPHSGSNSYRLQGRADYKLERYNAKASLTWFANREQELQYSTYFKYNLDNYYAELKKEWMLGLRFRQDLSLKTSYSLGLSRFSARTQAGVLDTAAEKERSWWQDYTFLSDADANGDSIYDAYAGQGYVKNINNPYGVPGYFVGYGLARLWRRTADSYNGFNFKLNHQVNEKNNLEGGIDLKKYRVYLKENSLPWDPVPFKDYYDFDPANLAIYLQEKLELSDLVLTAGVRLDRFMPNAGKKANNFNLTDTASYIEARDTTMYSLRLGFLHKISGSASFRVNFGRYVQQPSWDYLYKNLTANIARGTTVLGEPELMAPYTIAYDAGLSRRFGQSSELDLSMYYKDVYDLIDTAYIQDTTTGLSYSGFKNNRQANIRGLELTYELKPLGKEYSILANYSFQMTKYNTDAPNIVHEYIYGGVDNLEDPLLNPKYINTYFLNWDQRHKFVLNLGWGSGSDFGPWFFGGQPLSDISIGLFNNANSGFPYTVLGYFYGNIVGDINHERLPWTFNTDLKAEKIFKLSGVNLTLGLEVLNLFNRKNTTGIFPQTGLTDAYGTPPSYDDFAGKTVLDSLPGGIDSSGHTMMYPNPDYSKWRDLNGDGVIDDKELYLTYAAAYNDYVNDPYNSLRYPESSAYVLPRKARLVLGFMF